MERWQDRYYRRTRATMTKAAEHNAREAARLAEWRSNHEPIKVEAIGPCYTVRIWYANNWRGRGGAGAVGFLPGMTPAPDKIRHFSSADNAYYVGGEARRNGCIVEYVLDEKAQAETAALFGLVPCGLAA